MTRNVTFPLIFLLALLACVCFASCTEDIWKIIKEDIDEPDQIDIQAQEEFLKKERYAKTLLENMTLEEKVGQMFFSRCPESEIAAEEIKKYQLGGYILFGRDFKYDSPESITAKIQSYQDYAKIPLLIGVDEEGGRVNRVSMYSQYGRTPFPSPQELYAEGGFKRIKADTMEKCAFLKIIGINVNLAPVCDVSTDPSDFIYNRTLGQNAPLVADYVRVIIDTMNDLQMGSVLKHFPGYGSGEDTHEATYRDSRSYGEFEKKDFIPFQAGIEAGAEAILMCHNIMECLDYDLPASLSPTVHQLLRNTLGFRGVIITDDLDMAAISQAYTPEEAAILAVEAGNDMIISSHYEIQIPGIIQAISHGRIDEKMIDAAVIRVLMWKQSLGLLGTTLE